MNSVNLSIIEGRLGKDPLIRKTTTELEVAQISVATQHSWYDKAKEKWESSTTWHKIVIWKPGKQLKDAKKGDMIYVQGRYQGRKWTDDKNVENYVMEIIAEKHWVLPTNQGKSFETDEVKQERKKEESSNNQQNDSGFDDLPF